MIRIQRLCTLFFLLQIFQFSLASSDGNKEDSIDESLYSRQLYVMGKDAQNRISNSKILITGLSGLGAEIAKNVILAGVKSVTLHDNEKVTYRDFASNFCLKEGESLGKNRAEASFGFLRELNPYVQVDVAKGKLGKTELAEGNYDCIVVVDKSLGKQLYLNKASRALNQRFISCSSMGVFGSVFCDFGDSFTVLDQTGEDPKTAIIDKIESEEDTVVFCVEDERHDFQTGDIVTFENVEGMEGLCDTNLQFKVKVINPFKFSIGDTRHLGIKGIGGRAVQVKLPREMSFKSLRDCIALPLSVVPSDFAKMDPDYQATLHACFCSLDDFRRSRGGKFPRAGCTRDALKFKRVVQRCPLLHSQKQKVEIDESLVDIFSRTCSGNLSPMASFLGGVIAQEVLKSCSRVFVPLHQMLLFDAVEALPDTLPDAEDCAPKADRYDGQRAVLGNTLQGSLQDQRHFVVGSGAIGCELLKMYALMGMGCGKVQDDQELAGGHITVTDMDTIERSNLNRQFLFREKDVGTAKSAAAAAAVKAMNPDVQITALEKKVAPDTEDYFDAKFWDSLDGVSNALDNVEARLYVDSQCVAFRKPLLESGTLGVKGNTQVVVPGFSESYGSSSDPPETDIPLCTLKNFPYAIEHTIHWARDLFTGFFKKQPEVANRFLKGMGNPDLLEEAIEDIKEQSALGALRALNLAIEDIRFLGADGFKDCVSWALQNFNEYFKETSEALLRAHPLSSVDDEGEPFWSGAKKAPIVPVFDPTDPAHVDFVWYTARLRAFIYGFNAPDNQEDIAFQTQISEFDARAPSNKTLPTPVVDEASEEAEEDSEGSHEAVEGSIQELRAALKESEKYISMQLITSKENVLEEIEFEKDDDSNGHIDFITAASNLRAICYSISPVDPLQTKRIAGKIVPAMATTTAVVAGLVGLELLKLVQHKKMTSHKNGFINLGEPFVAFSEPVPAERIKIGNTGHSFTLWDRLEIYGGKLLSIRDLDDKISEIYGPGIKISSISFQGILIYADFLADLSDSTLQSETMRLLSEVIEESVGCDDIESLGPILELELLLEDDFGEDVAIPPVNLHMESSTEKTAFPLFPNFFSSIRNQMISKMQECSTNFVV